MLFHNILTDKIKIETKSLYVQLKKKISKDPEVRMSKWHIQPLSAAQKSYAATDAYVCAIDNINVKIH